MLAFQPVAIGKNSRQRRLKTGLLENLDTNRRDFHAVPLDPSEGRGAREISPNQMNWPAPSPRWAHKKQSRRLIHHHPHLQ